ncbi:hypothetical protein RLW55_01795 [Hyphomicrobium sp. B1]|uniref:hypothetical protein n=1 Tax=Hyphomicrobium sp. B1 TaxID=3075651 RepID=UPI003C2C44D9
MDTTQLKDFASDLISNPIIQALGIGGLLLAAASFSVQLWRYGPAIQRLNKLEVLSQLYHLGETQKEMTRSFGEATAACVAMRLAAEDVRQYLDNLREYLVEVQERNSETNATQIIQARLEQAQGQEDLEPGTYFKRSQIFSVQPKTPEQLFENMKNEWTKFLDSFRNRLEEAGIQPQLNRIGKMTYMLTDKRRRYPLALETAELITALHSQYKRYLALRSVSLSEHDAFVQLVKTAIQELKKKGAKPDATDTAELAEAPAPH